MDPDKAEHSMKPNTRSHSPTPSDLSNYKGGPTLHWGPLLRPRRRISDVELTLGVTSMEEGHPVSVLPAGLATVALSSAVPLHVVARSGEYSDVRAAVQAGVSAVAAFHSSNTAKQHLNSGSLDLGRYSGWYRQVGQVLALVLFDAGRVDSQLVQVVVHRLSSTLQSACKVRSEESVTQEGLRSREVGGASLLLNECPPALRWQLLPDVAVEEAREGAGADPLHADAVAETEWERARTYFEAQDDLQVALQTALPKWAGQLPFDDGACLPDPPTVATSDVRGAVGAQASSLGESLGQGASTENPASGLPDGPDAGGAATPQAAVVEHAEASVEHGGHSELILQGHEKLQLGFLDGALVRAGMEGCIEAQSSDTAAHIVALEVPHTTSGTPSLLPARLWLAPTDGGTERPLELPFRGALPPTTALHFKAGDPASLGGVLGMSVMVKHLPSSTAVVVRGRLGSMLPEGPGQASIIVDVPPHPSGQPFKGLQSSPPARWNTSNHRLLWKLQDLAADVEFSAKAKLAVEQASQDPASAATHAPWRGRFQFSSQQVPGALSALGLTLEASDQGSLRWQHSVELVAVGKVSVTG